MFSLHVGVLNPYLHIRTILECYIYRLSLNQERGYKRKPYDWQVWGKIPRVVIPAVSPETAVREWCGWGRSQQGVRPHAPVNYTFFFLCHGFIKLMYINKILMKTRLYFFILCVTMWLYFFYITCYNVNYFVSKPVGLDFTSGSGFYQWVWILLVCLEFASGSRFEDPMGQTPCYIMWSTHNHGMNIFTR